MSKTAVILTSIAAGLFAGGYAMYLGNTAPAVAPIAAPDIAAARKPIVVKLHAQWCPKCMVTKGVWADLEKEYADRVHLVVLDFTNDASSEASRKEAQRLGLERFFDEFSGVTGIVVVLRATTKEVAAELEFSHALSDYRAAIDAAIAAGT